jgi:protein-S-isoprenylcysteine O-methyltransferase Ste14
MMWSTAIRAASATILYAIVHSLLASLPAKQRGRQIAGARAADGLYRFAFNGFAVISFAVTLRSIWRLPDRRLYTVRGAPSLVLVAGQLATAIALIQTNRQNGLGHVTGIRHAHEFVTGRSISPTPVVQHPLPEGDCLEGWTGTFRLSSHPNNYLVLLLYWLSPVMTVKWASVGAVTAAYRVLGSLHEDHRLLAAYGERYRCYRAKVPHLALHSVDHWRAALRGDERDG